MPKSPTMVHLEQEQNTNTSKIEIAHFAGKWSSDSTIRDDEFYLIRQNSIESIKDNGDIQSHVKFSAFSLIKNNLLLEAVGTFWGKLKVVNNQLHIFYNKVVIESVASNDPGFDVKNFEEGVKSTLNTPVIVNILELKTNSITAIRSDDGVIYHMTRLTDN